MQIDKNMKVYMVGKSRQFYHHFHALKYENFMNHTLEKMVLNHHKKFMHIHLASMVVQEEQNQRFTP